MAARILEHELNLAKHKLDARKDLKRHQGINFKTVLDGLKTLFGQIASDGRNLSMDDIARFLGNNAAFVPQ